MRSRIEAQVHRAAEELARRLRSSKPVRHFGIELEVAEPGRAVLRMRVAARHRQAHGVVHGGILAALADTAGGMATYMLLPWGTRVATVEMKINYLEPVERGRLVAEARVLRRGRNLAVAECDIRDHDGRLAAKALMTFAVVSRGKSRPRRRRSKPRAGAAA